MYKFSFLCVHTTSLFFSFPSCALSSHLNTHTHVNTNTHLHTHTHVNTNTHLHTHSASCSSRMTSPDVGLYSMGFIAFISAFLSHAVFSIPLSFYSSLCFSSFHPDNTHPHCGPSITLSLSISLSFSYLSLHFSLSIPLSFCLSLPFPLSFIHLSLFLLSFHPGSFPPF